ncbi:hypothetical protein L3Y34_010884 [Caenorhabditis briggsae]|uniref:Uncharacterized protein n=1 Tax=Caenorhabditis briggsae TaxID=6238 RepID=A0AAE9CTQ5_CAEBR|nr:hypothetical protein L3Y34_010884 [Caenorhabditis briggsae]
MAAWKYNVLGLHHSGPHSVHCFHCESMCDFCGSLLGDLSPSSIFCNSHNTPYRMVHCVRLDHRCGGQHLFAHHRSLFGRWNFYRGPWDVSGQLRGPFPVIIRSHFAFFSFSFLLFFTPCVVNSTLFHLFISFEARRNSQVEVPAERWRESTHIVKITIRIGFFPCERPRNARVEKGTLVWIEAKKPRRVVEGRKIAMHQLSLGPYSPGNS